MRYPLFVGIARADAGDGLVDLFIGVPDGAEQGANAPRRALALAAPVADQDAIQRVGQGRRVAGLVLDPVEVALPGLVGGVQALGHDALEPSVDLLIEKDVYSFGIVSDDALGDLKVLAFAPYDLFEPAAALGEGQFDHVVAVVEQVEGVDVERNLLSCRLDAVAAAAVRW